MDDEKSKTDRKRTSTYRSSVGLALNDELSWRASLFNHVYFYKHSGSAPYLRNLHLQNGGAKPAQLQKSSSTEAKSPEPPHSKSKALYSRILQKLRLLSHRNYQPWSQVFIPRQIDLQRSRQGFAMIQLLALLPLVLTLLFGLATFNKNIISRAKALHECRQSVLSLQKKLLADIKGLLKLNPKARRWQKQKVRAYLRLKAATASANAPLIAALKAEIVFIKSQQALLALQQNYHFVNSQSTYLKWSAGQKSIFSKKNKAIALTIDSQDIASTYKLDTPFTQKQSIQITNPVQLKAVGDFQAASFDVACAASIEKTNQMKGRPWLLRLVAVK